MRAFNKNRFCVAVVRGNGDGVLTVSWRVLGNSANKTRHGIRQYGRRTPSHGSAFPEHSVAQRQRRPVIVDQLRSAVRIRATLLWCVLPHVSERVQLQHGKRSHVITVPEGKGRKATGQAKSVYTCLQSHRIGDGRMKGR